MEKNTTTVLVAGMGVVFAAVIGYMSYNLGVKEGARSMHTGMVSTENKEDFQKPQQAMVMDHSQMTMDEMSEGLKGLEGDAFDKAFVEMMIVHHQGAVDMAKEIPAHAKHSELKKLGEEIITAQTKEIQMMQGWLKSWGYEQTEEKAIKSDVLDTMPGMKH